MLVNPQEIVSVRRALDTDYTKPDPNVAWFYAELTEITLKNGHTFLVTESIEEIFDILKDYQ